MSQSVDMRKELEAAIVDTLDDLDLDFALMSVKVQKAIPKMSLTGLVNTLTRLQVLKRQIFLNTLA